MCGKFYRYNGIIIFILIFSIAALGCAHNDIKVESFDDIYVSRFFSSFVPGGMCYLNSEDGLIHFFDAESGTDIILCSNPNCTHKKNTTGKGISCDAYYGSKVYSPIMTSDKLIILSAPEDNMLFDCIIYTADLDGRNRKEVTRLENVQNIGDIAYMNDLVAVCFWADLDDEKKEYSGDVFSYGKLEKRHSGVYIVNIKTGATSLVVDLEDKYSALTHNCSFCNDTLYYGSMYFEKEVDYSNYTNETEYYDDVRKYSIQELHAYNMKTEEDLVIWKGNNELIEGYNKGIYVITGDDDITVYNEGREKTKIRYEDLTPQGVLHRSFQIYPYGDILYMCDGKYFWSKDCDTGEIRYVADGSLNERGITWIHAITGKWVYFGISVNGMLENYVSETTSFF